MMTTNSDKAAKPPIPLRFHVASATLMGMGLLAVIQLHLVAALLAGLLVFQLVHMLAGAVRIPYLNNRYMKLLLVAFLAIIVVTVLGLIGIGIGTFLRKGPDNLA